MSKQAQVEQDQKMSIDARLTRALEVVDGGLEAVAALLAEKLIELGGDVTAFYAWALETRGWSKTTAYEYRFPVKREAQRANMRSNRSNAKLQSNSNTTGSSGLRAVDHYDDDYDDDVEPRIPAQSREVIFKSVGQHLNALALAIPDVPVKDIYAAMETQIGGISVELLEELNEIIEWVSALRDMVKPHAVSCSTMKGKK